MKYGSTLSPPSAIQPVLLSHRILHHDQLSEQLGPPITQKEVPGSKRVISRAERLGSWRTFTRSNFVHTSPYLLTLNRWGGAPGQDDRKIRLSPAFRLTGSIEPSEKSEIRSRTSPDFSPNIANLCWSKSFPRSSDRFPCESTWYSCQPTMRRHKSQGRGILRR